MGRPGPKGGATYVRPGYDVGRFMFQNMDAWASYAFSGLDRNGGLVMWSGRMVALTGYGPDEIERDGFFPLLFPDPRVRTQAQEQMVAFLDGAANNQMFHWTVRRRDGVDRTVWANSVVMPDEAEDRFAVFMSMRDATDYPGALGYDHATRRGFEELVESAPDVIVRIRASDGRCVYINRAVERITTFAPGRFYREPDLWLSVFDPPSRRAFEAAFADAKAGAERDIDVHWTLPERSVALAIRLYPIRDDTGSVFAVEGLARDLTGSKALEQRLNRLLDDKEAANLALTARMRELEAANDKLRSLDRLKSEILGNVSHELRTPLVTICGYAELLLAGGLGELNRKQRQALDVTRRNGRRLANLIENMLEFSRIEEGRTVLQRERVDVNAAVREAAEELPARLEARGIRLTLDLPGEPVVVTGDHLRLLLVVRNLLGNAEKFTPEGGAITVRLARDDGDMLLTVQDTGIGIPAEHLGRVFERFFQVDGSATRQHPGAGLGLAIVREIVELHDGRVSVTSDRGRGSVFSVRLPVAGATPARRRRETTKRRSSAPA